MCRKYDCGLLIEPINGETAPYKITIRNELGEERVVASWGAHQGIVNGGNSLRLYAGPYETCYPGDCDFYIEPIPEKPDTFKIIVQNLAGDEGVVAAWGAHQGIVNGGNSLQLYTGSYESCHTTDSDLIFKALP